MFKMISFRPCICYKFNKWLDVYDHPEFIHDLYNAGYSPMMWFVFQSMRKRDRHVRSH